MHESEHVSVHGEFGSNISYPLRHIFTLFCIITSYLYLWFHSMHIKIFNPNILLHEGHSLAYTTRVGGNGQFTTVIECGISWIYFRKSSQSVRRQGTGMETFTDILVKRAISSAETDGLEFFSTRRRCSSRISCYKFTKRKGKKEDVRIPGFWKKGLF